MARKAYSYILDHFMDREWGGIYWELDENGQVSSSRKQIYAIAFAIYGLTEYHMATGTQDPLDLAIQLYREIEMHALDRNLNGYIEALGRRWDPVEDLRLSIKDENERKTMNTHLHVLEAYTSLYRIWKDPGLASSLQNLIQLFLGRFVDPESHHLKLFFDDRWNLKSSLVSFGHDIECSWLLHEASSILGNGDLTERTGKVAVKMARATFAGLDNDGGLFYEFFPEENRFDTDKHWWPQAEAMVGYFNAYQCSGQQVFLKKCLKSWKFINEFLVDREHGEWYWSVDRSGVPQVEKEKAGFWKCPYHNGRACLELIGRIDEWMNSSTINN
jgi:mannobiose 2-epimerase